MAEYNYPEYRYVGEREFLEGEVGAFVEHAEQVDDYYEYDGHYIRQDSLDAHSEHPADARIQIHTVEYEPQDNKDDDLEQCEGCGEWFKSVSHHQALSNCADAEVVDE